MHDVPVAAGTTPPGCRLAWGMATHPGRVRPYQQDAYLAAPPVFVVADGMGGHARGEAAAAAAVQSFRGIRGPWVSADDILAAVEHAAGRVASLAGDDPAPPGTTVVGAGLTVLEDRVGWLIFNVGDSRAYRLADDLLEQISVDHSRVQELSDELGLDRELARNLPGGHVITRALGGGLGGVPEVDWWVLAAGVGDRVLLCSDGLTDEVRDQDISRILRGESDPQAAALALQDAALVAGGRDNVTVLVIDAIDLPTSAEVGRGPAGRDVDAGAAARVTETQPIAQAPAPTQVERLLGFMEPDDR